MSTLTAAVSSSAVCQLYPSWTIGSIPTSKRNPCRSFSGGSSQTRLKPPPRAALVDAEPRSVPTLRDVSLQVPELAGNFVDDLQAEARAMARAANASVYSPQFLAAKYGSKPIKVVRRALLIIISLGSFGLKLFLDQGNGVLDKKRRLRATELRSIFTRLGPTFVKLGQGLSLRPDICPPEYLEELSELQNGLPTFPDDEAFSCIERELGQSLDSIFSSISPSSITAASLGQVYKAQLKYSGKLVAVKVQRPEP